MKDASTFYTSGAEKMLGTELMKAESVSVWAIARACGHIKTSVYGQIGLNDDITSMSQ